MPGAALVAVGLTAVLLPLIQGRELGWPAWTWVSLALAAGAPGRVPAAPAAPRRATAATRCWTCALFRERGFSAGHRDPAVPGRPRRRRSSSSSRSTCSSAAGLAALEAGLVFTILAVAYVATSGPAPALTARYGRLVVAAGGVALTRAWPLLAAGRRPRSARAGIAARAGPRARPGRRRHRPLLHAAHRRRCSPTSSRPCAGSAAGAMSTMQQVGYALGVAITGVIFFGAADDGIGHAFELSLIQLAIVAAGIVVMARLLPGTCAKETGIRQMSHKHNKSPIRWLRRQWSAPASTSRRTSTATPSCTPASTSPPSRSPQPRTRWRRSPPSASGSTEMSADDVLELRELTALADELGELTGGASTVVLRPARLSALLRRGRRASSSRASRPTGSARRTTSRSRCCASCSSRWSSSAPRPPAPRCRPEHRSHS